MIVSVIPARGGSKGIPGKNLVEVGGYPLIYYSIQPSLGSMVDRTIVSTDDNDIREVSLSFGAEVLDRPSHLAQDSTPTEPVVVHVIEALRLTDQDIIVLLQPTSPIRAYHTINDCLVSYNEAIVRGYDAIFTAHYEKYYHWYVIKEPVEPKVTIGEFPPIEDDPMWLSTSVWRGRGFAYWCTREPRQKVQLDVRENGNVFVTSAYNFINHNRFGTNPAPYITGPMLGMELDEPWQVPIFDVILDKLNRGEQIW